MLRRKFLEREWSPLNKKPLSAYKDGSNFKAFWEHQCECGEKHIWEAQIVPRFRSVNCPICINRGKYICPCKSLQTLRPDLAEQWHPTKNNKTPSEVSLSSGKKFWWLCPKSPCEHPHEWEAFLDTRTKTSGCPFCSNQRKCPCTSLAKMRPEIAAQWHPRNKLRADEVSYGSGYMAWWLCAKGKCEHIHEWQVTVNNRTNGDTGCPWCANRKICGCNSLAALFPELVKEWSPKNSISPYEVAPSSHKKYWWKCSKGHEWSAVVYSRTRPNSGCPKCKESQGEKLLKEILTSLELDFIDQYRISPGRHSQSLDFYLPRYSCAIEFDGFQHFEAIEWFGGENGLQKRRILDLKKDIYCKENHISLLRIYYSDLTEIEAMVNFLINPPTVLAFRLYTTSYPKF